MKTRFTPLHHRHSGYALIMIMCFLAISLVAFSSMMYWVSTNAKITQRNNYFTAAEAAAESATENSLAYMIRDFTSGGLGPASSYTNEPLSQTVWPVQYIFSNIRISIGSTIWTNLPAPFTGLSGLVQYCTNTATATATAATAPVSVPATAQQVVQFAIIPLFQYAIFYNLDMEVEPGNTMTINGRVHSNNNIWTTGNSASLPLTYQGLVDATSGVFLQGSTNSSQSGAAPPNSVIFTTPYQTGVSSLTMPVGTNNNPASTEAILQPPPPSLIAPNSAAYSSNGLAYLYNESDLIITNDSTGTNITVLYDNQNNVNKMTTVPPDVVSILTNSVRNNGVTSYTYTTNAYYSFVTNSSFYDYRESDTVKAIQINVGALGTWLTNASTKGGSQYNSQNTTGGTSKGHGINSIYVYNSVPLSSSQLPAVRLVNGQQLPSAGLTVSTPDPIYVKGNYNTTTNGINFALTLGSTTNGATLPAALMGDAVTVLSSNWSDSYNSSTALSSRTPAATTVNAALLAGIVPSANGANYSGGVENFMRLLENWSSQTLTYNGSIVCMFASQYATNHWQQTGNYYNAPIRQWGFDVNFLKGQEYLPPCGPEAKYLIRASWAAW